MAEITHLPRLLLSPELDAALAEVDDTAVWPAMAMAMSGEVIEELHRILGNLSKAALKTFLDGRLTPEGRHRTDPRKIRAGRATI